MALADERLLGLVTGLRKKARKCLSTCFGNGDVDVVDPLNTGVVVVDSAVFSKERILLLSPTR